MSHRTLSLALVATLSLADAVSSAGPPQTYKATLTYDTAPTSDLKRPDGSVEERMRVRTQRIKAGFEWPFRPLAGKWMGGFAVETDHLALGWEGFDGPEALTAFTGKLNAMRPLNAKWKMIGLFKAGVASDLHGLKRRDLTLQGGLLFSYALSSRTDLGIGAILTNNFGAPRILPGLSVTYNNPSEKSRIAVRFPLSAEAWYLPNQVVELGVLAKIEGNNFHLNKPGNYQGRSLAYSTWYAGPAIKLKPNATLALQAEAVRTLRRDFEIRDGNDALEDWDLKDEWLARISVSLSLPALPGDAKAD